MSVYTSLNHAQIEHVINHYQLAPLLSFSGISAGIENTNYLVKTQQGDFILTLYERFSANEVLPYLNFLQQLAQQENYYPYPILDKQQKSLQHTAGKPSALFQCLAGTSVLHASRRQCQATAKALATLHLSPTILPSTKPKNIDWIQSTAAQLLPTLSLADAQLLQDELSYQLKQGRLAISSGTIHADLFKDNVLFIGDTLTGLLDFYAASNDYYLLDIAITLNDWCINKKGLYDYQQQAGFIQAYRQIRPLSVSELTYLPLLLRRACLRFWLSRLGHQANPKLGEITQEKDPNAFKNLLLQHRQFYA